MNVLQNIIQWLRACAYPAPPVRPGTPIPETKITIDHDKYLLTPAMLKAGIVCIDKA